MAHDKVYLVQTDTTVGFLSSDDKKLTTIKKRPQSQKILQTVDSFTTLKTHTRVPVGFKKIVRNSHLTTFIYPNGNSFRIIDKQSNHYRFISKFHSLYSTSANETKKSFDFDFAYRYSDVIVFNQSDFCENSSSKIIKLGKYKKKKIR